MKNFLIIWSGQFVSKIGTALTQFALLIWAYEQTQSAMTVALLGFFSFLPAFIMSPIAGVWVDRVDRRKIMLLADLGAGAMTLMLLTLYTLGKLQIAHLYVAQAVAGTFGAFQSPAYSAAMTTLLPKAQYARANGLRAMAQNGADILSPMLAGVLLWWLGIGGVMLIDVATFLVAVGTLTLVHVPPLAQRATADEAARGTNFLAEMQVGFRYAWQRPGLVGLMLVYMAMNFAAALTYFSTLPALILARSGGNELALATVQAALGGAGLLGALLISIWGGPRRRIHGVLMGAALSFFLGDFTMAIGRTLPMWVLGGVLGAIFIPVIDSSNMSILQSKVAPSVQGRVFSVFSMVRQAFVPAGYLLGGLLAERWLEPAMLPQGALAARYGWLVGTGPGAGIALMFVFTALSGALFCLAGYLFPAVRHIEDELPDHDVAHLPDDAMPDDAVPEDAVRQEPKPSGS